MGGPRGCRPPGVAFIQEKSDVCMIASMSGICTDTRRHVSKLSVTYQLHKLLCMPSSTHQHGAKHHKLGDLSLLKQGCAEDSTRRGACHLSWVVP